MICYDMLWNEEERHPGIKTIINQFTTKVQALDTNQPRRYRQKTSSYTPFDTASEQKREKYQNRGYNRSKSAYRPQLWYIPSYDRDLNRYPRSENPSSYDAESTEREPYKTEDGQFAVNAINQDI